MKRSTFESAPVSTPTRGRQMTSVLVVTAQKHYDSAPRTTTDVDVGAIGGFLQDLELPLVLLLQDALLQQEGPGQRYDGY